MFRWSNLISARASLVRLWPTKPAERSEFVIFRNKVRSNSGSGAVWNHELISTLTRSVNKSFSRMDAVNDSWSFTSFKYVKSSAPMVGSFIWFLVRGFESMVGLYRRYKEKIESSPRIQSFYRICPIYPEITGKMVTLSVWFPELSCIVFLGCRCIR